MATEQQSTEDLSDVRVLRRLATEWARDNRIVCRSGRFIMEYYRLMREPVTGMRIEQKQATSLNRLKVTIHSLPDDSTFLPEWTKMQTAFGKACIELEVKIPDDYPMSSPAVCVVWPRMKSGYVHPDGSICFEMFSRGGWSCTMTFGTTLLALYVFLVGSARPASLVDVEGTRSKGPVIDTDRAYASEHRLAESHSEWQR